MNLPPLHTLSISAFTPRAEISTDNEFLELPDWRKPNSQWRMTMLRFLVNRARVEGMEFSNASGVVFDEDMLFSEAGYISLFTPVSCTDEEYKAFAEADYLEAENGIKMYNKHLHESGIGAVFRLLENGGPDMTVEQAIARATPQPERLKLLFELLNGKVTPPHGEEPFKVLEQKLHAVSGMRDPPFVNPAADNNKGAATNTGFQYVTIQQQGRNLFMDNGTVTRSFFSNPDIKQCCEGGSGTTFAFEIGSTVGNYTDNDFGAKDTIVIPEGQQVTFLSVKVMPRGWDAHETLQGAMIFNKGQIFTSMSPRWTYKPPAFNPATDDPLATYALKVKGPVDLRCTIQSPRSNYIDMALLSATTDEDNPGALNITTAMLPVVILPGRMAFKVEQVVTDQATSKRVVFATYMPYDPDDPEHFPKRSKPQCCENTVVVLSDDDDED